MKPARVLSTSLVAMFVATLATAQEPTLAPPPPGAKYTLAYKFQAGDILRYEIDHRASVQSTIEGTTQRAVTRSESTKVWKVQDVMADGEIEFVHMVERVKMTNRLPDRAEMVYDSESDATPPPGFEDAARAVGTPLSIIRMSPQGEVLNRDVKHKQPAADTEAPVTALLPADPVAIGDKWNEPRTVKVKTTDGAVREIQTRRHYELTKVSNGIATIESTYQVLSPTDPAIDSQLVQRLMKGTVKFDIEKGRVVSQEMAVDERVLGFAGPTSSMNYQMKMTEKLQSEAEHSVAIKPVHVE